MNATPAIITDEELRVETDELRRLLTVAGLNFEAWLALQTTPHWRVQNRYVPYFQTAINAHFTSMIMALYCLHETNPKSVNVPILLRQLRTAERLPHALLDQLEEAQVDLKTLWIKISVLRNKVFGHRERGITFDDVFVQAAVKPSDFEALLDKTAKLLNVITKALFRDIHAFNLGSKQAVLALHEDIERAYPFQKEGP